VWERCYQFEYNSGLKLQQGVYYQKGCGKRDVCARNFESAHEEGISKRREKRPVGGSLWLGKSVGKIFKALRHNSECGYTLNNARWTGD